MRGRPIKRTLRGTRTEESPVTWVVPRPATPLRSCEAVPRKGASRTPPVGAPRIAPG